MSDGTEREPEDDDEPPSGRRVARGVLDRVPDVRDGLTRVERTVLWQLSEAQKEFPGRMVPTATLYGRVVEHVDLDEREFLAVLRRLVGRTS